MKRRLLSALLAVVLVLALAACGGGGTPASTPPASTPDAGADSVADAGSDVPAGEVEGTTYVYAWGDSHIESYKKLESAFNEANPQFKLSYEQDSSLKDVLVTRAASDNLPDMFYVSPYVSTRDWASGDWLYDLSDQPWVANLTDGIRESVSYEGKVYGFPYSVCYTGFFYDMDLFEELDLSVPTTVAEFRSVCEALQTAGYTPIAVGGGGADTWVLHQMFQSLAGTALGDGFYDFVDAMNAGTGSYHDIPHMEDFKAMMEMCFKEFNVANPQDLDYSGMVPEFAAGKAGMYHNGSWSVANVMELNPEMNVGFFGYPISGNGGDVKITWETEISLVMSKDSATPEACLAFMEYLASGEGADNIGNLQGRIPVTDVDISKDLVSNTYDDALKYVEDGQSGPWLHWQVPTGFEDDFGRDLQTYLLGNIEFEELLDIADTKWASFYNA